MASPQSAKKKKQPAQDAPQSPSRVHNAKWLGGFLLFAAIAFGGTYYWRSHSGTLASAKPKMTAEDFRAQLAASRVNRESELVKATTQNETAQAVRLIAEPKSETERADNLRSLITHFDSKGGATWSPVLRLALLKESAAVLKLPTDQLEPKQERQRLTARIYAARLLNKLASMPALSTPEDKKLRADEGKILSGLATQLDRTDDAYTLVLEANMQLQGSTAASFDKLKSLCQSKELTEIRSCLMTISEISDVDKKTRAINWVKDHRGSIDKSLQPLALRVLFASRALLDQKEIDGLFKEVSAKTTDDWNDVFLAMVDESKTEKIYVEKIRVLVDHSTDTTIRLRAQALLARAAKEGS